MQEAQPPMHSTAILPRGGGAPWWTTVGAAAPRKRGQMRKERATETNLTGKEGLKSTTNEMRNFTAARDTPAYTRPVHTFETFHSEQPILSMDELSQSKVSQ